MNFAIFSFESLSRLLLKANTSSELCRSAARTFLTTGRSCFFLICTFVFRYKKALVYTNIGVIPRQYFIIAYSSVCVKFGVDSVNFKRFHPLFIVKEVRPAVELTAKLDRRYKNLAETSVAFRKDRL